MTATLKKIANDLMTLPPEERLELADMLYERANPGDAKAIEQAWSEEIKRRVEDVETGRVKLIPSEKVHAEIRRKLNEIKARRLSPRPSR
ncbi:MAG: putative addiction module component [Verrucomicrobiota bacterium]